MLRTKSANLLRPMLRALEFTQEAAMDTIKELDFSLGSNLISLFYKYPADFGVKRAKHCFEEIKVNLEDPKWSAVAFVDSISKLEEADSKSNHDIHSYFLSLLLVELSKMSSLPPALIKELTVYYKWPSSMSEIGKNTVDPLVEETLTRFSKQQNMASTDPFVEKKFRKKIRNRNVRLTILFLVLFGLVVLMKQVMKGEI